jgi:hypothetical protein
MYLDIYIFLFFIIIIFICFYSYRKKNIEHFNGVSEYPKKFIMQNCQMNLVPYVNDPNEQTCENSAFTEDGQLLKNLCDQNQDFQVMELEVPHGTPEYGQNMKKNKYFGCGVNQSNVLGLNWNQPSFHSNIKHKSFTAPPLLYDLYFNNNPYVGSWAFQPSIGQIDLDGSNFYNIQNTGYLGKWNELNMIQMGYSISFWVYSTGYSNLNIIQLTQGQCEIKVNGYCGKEPSKSNSGWFGQGGGSIDQCSSRRDTWSNRCKWRKPLKRVFSWFGDLVNDVDNLFGGSGAQSSSNSTSVDMRYIRGQPAITLDSYNVNVAMQTYQNFSNVNVWQNDLLKNNFEKKWYSLNHFLISFSNNEIKVFNNGELVKTFSVQSMPTPKDANVFLGAYNSSTIYIKNLLFWNMNFNERFAHDLYQSYLPIIREPNKIKLMGKKMKSNEESFKAPFKLNKRFTLGLHKDLNFISKNSITISFTINVKKNYSNWVNIMLITLNNFDWNWRMPGIWLWPNKCALNICISTDYYWNEGIMEYDFPMNEDVHFKIVFDANSKKVILYKNKDWKSPIVHQCIGNFYNITDDYRVWIAANSFGENAYISNFEMEGGVYKPGFEI